MLAVQHESLSSSYHGFESRMLRQLKKVKKLDISEIKEGDKLFVNSLTHTRNAHGVNNFMENQLGKYIRIDAVHHSYVTAFGYSWEAADLLIDGPNSVETVSLNGMAVKFNPESL